MGRFTIPRVNIRPATINDAEVLAALARRTFHDTFAATNNPTDMALYLSRAYGVDQQTRELSDRDITTFLVEETGEAIGYAQLRAGHVPECVQVPEVRLHGRCYSVFLWRRPISD